MANFKASGIIVFNKFFNTRNPEMRARFIQALTPEEKKCYETALPMTWVPIGLANTLSVKAAQILYPNDPQALFKLGIARAHDNVAGIYRMILHIISVETVLRNSAKLWTQHHDQGRAFLETEGKNSAAYCVSDYAELPGEFRKIIKGFVFGMLELCGAVNIQTTLVEDNPQLWKWKATWM